MIPPEQKSAVTIEDLLRLKRAERPNPEFWSNFERELRQKQLTALVQKRRWWHDLPVMLSRRVYVPAGAAAIVAFTLVTVRYSTISSVAHVENTAPRIAAADPAVETLPVTVVSAPEALRGRYEEQLAPAAETRGESAPLVTATKSATTDMVGLLPMQAAGQATETPSARSIAANLAKIEQDEPELVNAVMGSRLSSPVRAQTVAATQADTESGSSQKYRLIARYADHSLSPEPVAPALVRERISRRLGDDITDRISRIGVEGSRVSLKF
jgi:hypothetical protein